MARGSAVTRPLPLPLPQVLLSQVHRLRALDLLGRFLDLGPWAVSLVRAGPARLPGVGGDKPLCLGVARHWRGTMWGAALEEHAPCGLRPHSVPGFTLALPSLPATRLHLCRPKVVHPCSPLPEPRSGVPLQRPRAEHTPVHQLDTLGLSTTWKHFAADSFCTRVGPDV